MARTASDIIDEKGGPAAVALKVGKSPGAVRVWKHRDCFPRECWPEIMQAFPDVTLDVLFEVEKARRDAAPAPAAVSAA